MFKNQFIIEGDVKVVGEVDQVSEKFSKRILVLSNDTPMKKGGTFEKCVAIEFSGSTMSLLDNITIGQRLEVMCELESREWKGSWFTSAKPGYPFENAIKVVGSDDGTSESTEATTSSDDHSDLPF